jgi:ubiquinol-cytochrome c reductase cytochrome c1 subunit
MKKLIITCLLLCLPVFAHASSEGIHLEKADVNLENKTSLRHGAKLFVNYCLSCHSASYMRYNRMAKDLGLTDDQVEENMMFIADFTKDDAPQGVAKSIGSLMTISMQKSDSEKYFGTAVPDLTVIARARGADYLYTYLTTFYLDDKRPTGVNNLAFDNVGMPHVLWELDGLKKKVTVKDEHGHETVKLERVTEGKMSDAEYKRSMNDLVNFLVYMGEPIKVERQRIGIFVMFFLLIFFLFAYLLKKEYWKDVH